MPSPCQHAEQAHTANDLRRENMIPVDGAGRPVIKVGIPKVPQTRTKQRILPEILQTAQRQFKADLLRPVESETVSPQKHGSKQKRAEKDAVKGNQAFKESLHRPFFGPVKPEKAKAELRPRQKLRPAGTAGNQRQNHYKRKHIISPLFSRAGHHGRKRQHHHRSDVVAPLRRVRIKKRLRQIRHILHIKSQRNQRRRHSPPTQIRKERLFVPFPPRFVFKNPIAKDRSRPQSRQKSQRYRAEILCRGNHPHTAQERSRRHCNQRRQGRARFPLRLQPDQMKKQTDGKNRRQPDITDKNRKRIIAENNAQRKGQKRQCQITRGVKKQQTDTDKNQKTKRKGGGPFGLPLRCKNSTERKNRNHQPVKAFMFFKNTLCHL